MTRFNTAFFEKAEAAILKARECDVVISVVFFLDGADAGADPFGKTRMFSEDARRYYRYVTPALEPTPTSPGMSQTSGICFAMPGGWNRWDLT